MECRTIQHWVEIGLGRDGEAEVARYPPRPQLMHKLDSYKGFIDTLQSAYPKIFAQRVFEEVPANYAGRYRRVLSEPLALAVGLPIAVAQCGSRAHNDIPAGNASTMLALTKDFKEWAVVGERAGIFRTADSAHGRSARTVLSQHWTPFTVAGHDPVALSNGTAPRREIATVAEGSDLSRKQNDHDDALLKMSVLASHGSAGGMASTTNRSCPLHVRQ